MVADPPHAVKTDAAYRRREGGKREGIASPASGKAAQDHVVRPLEAAPVLGLLVGVRPRLAVAHEVGPLDAGGLEEEGKWTARVIVPPLLTPEAYTRSLRRGPS